MEANHIYICTKQSLALAYFSYERKYLITGVFLPVSPNASIQFPTEQTDRSQYMDIMFANKLRQDLDLITLDNLIEWKSFLHYWFSGRGIHRLPVDSLKEHVMRISFVLSLDKLLKTLQLPAIYDAATLTLCCCNLRDCTKLDFHFILFVGCRIWRITGR